MFLQSTQPATSEEFESIAETLANLLRSTGDDSGANDVLSIVSRQVNTPVIGLRRAEHHLTNRDPSSALAALIPVWEAGYEDEEVEGLMGLVSLILGLDDVVDNLTDKPEPSESLRVLRWILSCCDTEVSASLDLSVPSYQWAVLRMARTLAHQGRSDIVGAMTQQLTIDGSLDLLSRMSSIPQRPWIRATPAQPPLNLRESITDCLTTPAPQAAYNWVWSAARQVFRGERVLLVGPQVERFAPLFAHGEVTVCTIGQAQDTECEMMTFASGAFDHIVMCFGFEHASSARDLTRLLWRGLSHGGQVHLVACTPNLAGHFPAYTHASRITSMLSEVGFEILGQQMRTTDGLPTEEADAQVCVARFQKNLV
ncbi:MAG: hypothetical protein ACPGQS_10720 [Bradymonadia bacterium]